MNGVAKERVAVPGSVPLRFTQEGEQGRIVAINGGGGARERLAALGLRPGVTVRVLCNPMDGKLLLEHGDSRLYLGGGMAHKIQVVITKGEER
ncbi:MAG: FeoA family protein [Desulfurivibrio sp.]|nr:FeoA family protein [Desulfurivibrio sp.]